MITTWSPGDDHGLVWAGGWALLEGSLPTGVVVDLWRRFSEGVDLGGFLQALSEASGGNLLAIPAFAVVLKTPAGPQAACRGNFVIEVVGGLEPERLSGAGVTTWVERTLVKGFPIVVRRGGDAAGAEPRPLVAGVVPAAALALASDGSTEVGPAVTSLREAAPGEGGSRADVPEKTPQSGRESPAEEVTARRAAPVPALEDGVGDPDDDRPPNGSDTLIFEDEDEFGPQADPPDMTPEPDALAHEFDALWGETVLTPIEDAAVRAEDDAVATPPAASPPRPAPVAPRPEPVAPPLEEPAFAGFIASVPTSQRVETGAADRSALLDLGDHDGMTIMQFDPDQQAASEPGRPQPSGESVVAVMCSSGHPNPPHRTTCRVCHAPVGGSPTRIPRPPLGWLRTSTGEEIELVAPVIAGRSPQAERVQGPVLPRLLALPHGHISGNHVEIRLQGWNVLAVDLHSRNGTFLRRTGEPPVRLPDQPTILVAGDVLDLGHGVQLSFQELP